MQSKHACPYCAESFDTLSGREGHSSICKLVYDLDNARGGCNTTDIEIAASNLEHARAKVLAEGLFAMADLIAESQGVFGLHLNGVNSPWSELCEGGRYEDWLLPFDKALEEARKMFPDLEKVYCK